MLNLLKSILKPFKPKFATLSENQLIVVSGQLWDQYDAPSYSTDPRDYGYTDFKGKTEIPVDFEPMREDERIDPERMAGLPWLTKAFKSVDQAMDFAYSCNLDSMSIRLFDRVDGVWVLSADQRVVEIDW